MLNFLNPKTTHPQVLKVVQYILGLSFCIAGFSKLFPFNSFLQQLLAYRLPLPEKFLFCASLFLVVLEIWIGLCIILDFHLQKALFLLRMLLFAMIPITIWGSFNKAPSCGCYGNLIHRPPWTATIEDVLILSISFLLNSKQKEENTQPYYYHKMYFIVVVCLVSFAVGLFQLNKILSFYPEKIY